MSHYHLTFIEILEIIMLGELEKDAIYCTTVKSSSNASCLTTEVKNNFRYFLPPLSFFLTNGFN